MGARSDSFTIPDLVGPVNLEGVPPDQRLKQLKQAFAKLGRRPTPKTASTRDRHETELSHVSIVIAMAERELLEPAPARRPAGTRANRRRIG